MAPLMTKVTSLRHAIFMKGTISEEAEEKAIQDAGSNHEAVPLMNFEDYSNDEHEFAACEEIFSEYFTNETSANDNAVENKNIHEQQAEASSTQNQIRESQDDKSDGASDVHNNTDDILDIFSNMG